MKFKNSIKIDSSGTSLSGQVYATYDKLVAVFGEPTCEGDEYKVQREWLLKFKDGTIATIYDWKEGDNYNGVGQGTHFTKVTDWHIGGVDLAATARVLEAIEEFDKVVVTA